MLFTVKRKSCLLVALIVLALSGLAFGCYFTAPTSERKPIEPAEKPYEYYQIIDQSNGKTLTYITSVNVSVGDEYLNEDGQWYQVVRVEENRAYARRFVKQR